MRGCCDSLGAELGRGADARTTFATWTGWSSRAARAPRSPRRSSATGSSRRSDRHAERGRPILGTCAGMIVCDREHLGLVDAIARRNAFGRQIASFEAELEMGGLGPEPIRAVFIRAPWIDEHGPEVEVLASVDGHPGGRARGRGPALRLPSRAHRRLPRARPADGDGHRRPRERAAERAGACEDRGVRDPRVEQPRPHPGPLLHRGEGGRHLRDRGPHRRRAADRRRLRGGPRGPAGTRSWRSPSRGSSATFFEHASDAQLEWVSPLAEWAAEEADCRIAIGADTNTRELSGVDPGAPDQAARGDPRS